MKFPRSARSAISMCAVLLVAAAASAVPPSLRSPEDVRELGELFMRSVLSGAVGSGYRGLAPFWTGRADQLAAEIVEAEKRGAVRRLQLGLSLGYELVGEQAVGERVLRLTYFERFDRGGIVWRLVFFKPEKVWQVYSVTESDDLGALFESR